jgi:hypothetical protein
LRRKKDEVKAELREIKNVYESWVKGKETTLLADVKDRVQGRRELSTGASVKDSSEVT